MPGLAGATLRKGGFFSGLRSQISFTGDREPVSKGKGRIVLKLFNRVAEELGPAFLEQGVWIKGQELGQFILTQPDDFRAGCEAVRVDGEKANWDRLSHIDWTDNLVCVRIRSHP
jgi:hypothetical protein